MCFGKGADGKLALPAYFENAVVVNETGGKRKNADRGYILLGCFDDSDGVRRAVRLIVNSYDSGYEIDDVQALYALRADNGTNVSEKKEASETETSHNAETTTPTQAPATGNLRKKNSNSDIGKGKEDPAPSAVSASSEISIADFMGLVKERFPNILPVDVAKKLGYKRESSEIESLKYSLKEGAVTDVRNEAYYTYDNLTKLPDMQVAKVGKDAAGNVLNGIDVEFSDSMTIGDIVKKTKENIRSFNEKKGNEYGEKYLYNASLGGPVVISTNGLKHGVVKSNNEKDRLARLALPAYFENAIVVNEMEGARNNADRAYTLIGCFDDMEGKRRVVRIIVNAYNGEYSINEVETVYSMYALRGSDGLDISKNKGTSDNAGVPDNTEATARRRAQRLPQPQRRLQESPGEHSISGTNVGEGIEEPGLAAASASSTVSIQEVLDFVKQTKYRNSLPQNAADRLGYKRESDELEGLKYSLKEGGRSAYFKEEHIAESMEKIGEGLAAVDVDAAEDFEAEEMAGKVLDRYESSYDKGKLAEAMNTVFRSLNGGSAEEVVENLAAAVRPALMESFRMDYTLRNKYDEMLRFFSGEGIALSEKEKQGVEEAEGRNFSAFRKEVAGRFLLQEDGTSLDSVWEELCSAYLLKCVGICDSILVLSYRYPATGGGGCMDIIASLFVAVLGGVICHLIVKWLDSNEKDDK